MLEACTLTTDYLQNDLTTVVTGAATTSTVASSVCCQTAIDAGETDYLLGILSACSQMPVYAYNSSNPPATSCSISTNVMRPDFTIYSGPHPLMDFPKESCCQAYLEGISTDVINQDACEQGYNNYAYDGTTCTADLVPIHPYNAAYAVTPITVGVSQEASTCCVMGLTDACG